MQATLFTKSLRIIQFDALKFSTKLLHTQASRVLNKNKNVSDYNDQLKLKIDLEESVKTGKLVPKIDISSIGISSLLGQRSCNEDRILSFELSPKLVLFGIFDGHGGQGAVDFISKNLKVVLKKFISPPEKDLPQLLKEVFFEINDSFIKTEKAQQGIDGAQVISGSTATVCLIRNAVELVVAHVGDTRATLCRSNKALRLTQDHKPDLRSEMKRIMDCNGTLSWSSFGKSRVNGRLEMTRSIGDRDLKEFGVIAEPDVVSIKLRHVTDSFLLLTTDGVHSKLNSAELMNAVNASRTPSEGAHQVTDLALFYGSKDNCSAAILPLGSWGKFNPTNQEIIFDKTSVFPRF